MTDAEFLQEVKRNVQEIDPQAEVWLFGSRARGEAGPDSDIDLLVILDDECLFLGRLCCIRLMKLRCDLLVKVDIVTA